MTGKAINLKAVVEIKRALKDVSSQIVFVGGAVIRLYADDEAADEVRPTTDIDVTIELAGFAELSKMQERLYQLGFTPDMTAFTICRYIYNDIYVDIMPSENSAIGASNRWYKPGLNQLQQLIVEGEEIHILPAPYFLATKFEAFNDRGKGDYRTSHDFEDIIYVIDNRTTLVEEIQQADKDVKDFLRSELTKLLNNPYVEEIILSHINPYTAKERYLILIEKIRNSIS